MRGNSAFKALLLLITVITVSGCGNSNGRERKQAPTGHNDVGVLIETNDSANIEQILKKYPEAQVRNLNPQHGLYEIFGLTLEQVQAEAPAANVYKNSFFDFKKQSVPGPAGLKVEGLKPCKAATQFPTSVATITQPTGPRASVRTVELGQTIKISSDKSKPNLLNTSPLNVAFIMVPPSASRIGQKVQLAKEFELTPDALGAYNIFVVVQDNRDVCAIDGLNIIVTANRPFQPTQQSGRVDLNKITHLAALSAQESWKLSQGEGIKIAIVDTGVNYNHPLLAPNMDKELGHDFVNSDEFPYDDDGHGTHVAGLAAARQIGMAQKATILAVKAMTSIGGDAGSIAAAIQYATDHKAQVINLSLGTSGPAPHPLILKAVQYAEEHGVLLVVAAGNGDPRTGLGVDIDTLPVYPAALPNENILTVAASSAGEALAPYSNFGAKGVDVVAPGGNSPTDPIFSTSFETPIGTKFASMSGTSMASPIVAGVAAQVWSQEPRMTAAEVKRVLIDSGELVPDLKTVTVSGRHLNAKAALSRAISSPVLF